MKNKIIKFVAILTMFYNTPSFSSVISAEKEYQEKILVQMELQKSILENDPEKVVKAIQKGANPFWVNIINGHTALYESLENLKKHSSNYIGSKAYRTLSVLSFLSLAFSGYAITTSALELKKILPLDKKHKFYELEDCTECDKKFNHYTIGVLGILGSLAQIYSTISFWKKGTNAAKALKIFKIISKQPGFKLDSESTALIENEFSTLRKLIAK